MNNFNFGEFDLFGEKSKPDAHCILAERFITSPFTVLDTKTGDWKKACEKINNAINFDTYDATDKLYDKQGML